MLLFSFKVAGFMQAGMIDTAIAGGVDFMSDVPIKFNRSMRSKMMSMGKVFLFFLRFHFCLTFCGSISLNSSLILYKKFNSFFKLHFFEICTSIQPQPCLNG